MHRVKGPNKKMAAGFIACRLMRGPHLNVMPNTVVKRVSQGFYVQADVGTFTTHPCAHYQCLWDDNMPPTSRAAVTSAPVNRVNKSRVV